nr:hypothetical protein [Pseudaestuariivita atlantica]
MKVTQVGGQSGAISALTTRTFDIIVTDLMLQEGSALAVADFANYRHPEARVIFVTNTTFFSDGSIFQHCSNACAYLPRGFKPEDLAALVEHHGADVSRARAELPSRAQG